MGLTVHYAFPSEEGQVECLTLGHLDIRLLGDLRSASHIGWIFTITIPNVCFFFLFWLT